MKTSPNKLITIRANFGKADPEIEEDIESVTARLYKNERHIQDLTVTKKESLNWQVQHVFPIDSELGDYQAIVEVKIKDEESPIIKTENITLVRDLNLQLQSEITTPKVRTVTPDEYREVPLDIKQYLEKKK